MAPAAAASASEALVVSAPGERPRCGELHGCGLLAAEHLADLTRQDHRVGVHLTQQTRGQQSLHRAIRRGSGSGIPGAAHRGTLEQAV